MNGRAETNQTIDEKDEINMKVLENRMERQDRKERLKNVCHRRGRLHRRITAFERHVDCRVEQSRPQLFPHITLFF